MPSHPNAHPVRMGDIELQTRIGNSENFGDLNHGSYDDNLPRKRPQKVPTTGMSDFPELTQPFDNYTQLDILTQPERKWITRLVISSIVDLGVSSTVALLSFSIAWRDSGLSLYCIGSQAIAHMLASITVILRFWKESRWGKYGEKDGRKSSSENSITSTRQVVEQPDEESEGLLLQERKRDFVREQKINLTIGFVFMLSAGILMIKAVMKFKFWSKWHEHIEYVQESSDKSVQEISEVLAWKSGTLYFIQATIRYFARQETGEHKFVNHIMWVSIMSCIFNVVLGLGASYQKEWSWKAEPIAAAMLSVGSCIEGMRILYVYFDDADDLLCKHSRP